jgi:hypothetical protein
MNKVILTQFFSTDNSANRDLVNGTWFVQEIIRTVETTQENTNLIEFFTNVQHHLCFRSKYGDCFSGQTPQIHYFSHRKFVICPRPKIARWVTILIQITLILKV